MLGFKMAELVVINYPIRTPIPINISSHAVDRFFWRFGYYKNNVFT